MKQLFITAVMAAGIFAVAQPAAAHDIGDWYFALNANSFSPAQNKWTNANGTFSDSAETGVGFSGAVGHEWDDFRLEGEVSWNKARLGKFKVVDGNGAWAPFTGMEGTYKGSVSSLVLLVNGYYDIDLGWDVVPYLGAGIGWARTTSNIKSAMIDGIETAIPAEFSSSRPAYQLGTGFGYDIGKDVTLQAGYRWFSTRRPITAKRGLGAHQFSLGLRYRF